MVINKVKVAMMQFLWTLTPVVIMIFCGLIGYAVAQQNKVIDAKADKPTVDALCETIKTKADKATIIQMLELLKQKDKMFEEKNKEQDSRINYNRDILSRQLEVMKNIELEMVKMNNRNIP